MSTLTKQTKKERMYSQIEAHGNNLNAIFNTGIEPIKLCKKLHSLEVQANRIAVDCCNGDNGVTTQNWELKTAPILAKIRKILYPNGMTGNSSKDWCIFINDDARGYALKIKDTYVRENNLRIYTDMGGYGILAPEFTGE